MDEELYGVLSSVAETHHIALNGTPEQAIAFRLTVMNGTAIEGCKPLLEVLFYAVILYMRKYDAEMIRRAKEALCAVGYYTSGDAQGFDEINGTEYYTYSLNCTKWRERHVATENHGA